MERKFSPIALVAALALSTAAQLGLTPSAVAAGVSAHRVADSHARASKGPAGLIAPAAVCPGQSRLGAPVQVQRQAMLCMIDFARGRVGLASFIATEDLHRSADDKSGDILRCDDFSHFACGREFTHWMKESGYLAGPCWKVGENLAWGSGEEGTVRAIFRAWMRSPSHRQNILGDFVQTGVGLRVGNLTGLPGTRVWAQHFGSLC